MRSYLFEILETILMGLAVYIIVSTSIQTVKVDGESMDPTLEHGQHLIVNKIVYLNLPFQFRDGSVNSGADRFLFFSNPSFGDMIVFHLAEQPTRDLVKRVIGVPGDIVSMQNGVVYVNGLLLQEPYINHRGNDQVIPTLVQPGHYYVLGDNRVASSDSRLLGQIPQENIVGKAWLAYWPLSNFGTLRSAKGVFKQ